MSRKGRYLCPRKHVLICVVVPKKVQLIVSGYFWGIQVLDHTILFWRNSRDGASAELTQMPVSSTSGWTSFNSKSEGATVPASGNKQLQHCLAGLPIVLKVSADHLLFCQLQNCCKNGIAAIVMDTASWFRWCWRERLWYQHVVSC